MNNQDILERIFLPEGTIDPELTVSGRNGMVVSEHPLASQAGLQILQGGGNAIDAAVAISACLSVVAPYMIGPAGIGYMLFYQAGTNRVMSLDFVGKTPALIPDLGSDTTSLLEGPRAALVPGALGGWLTASETFGTMSAGELLASAIRLAQEGFPIAPKQVPYFQRCAPLLGRNEAAASVFLPGGRPPRAGEMLVQRDLAHTFQLIAEKEWQVMYRGELADAIVRESEMAGGWLAHQDLNNFACEWEAPLSSTFQDYQVFTPPPPCSGAQILETLKLLEALPSQAGAVYSAETIHQLVECIKIAAADRIACGSQREPWVFLLRDEFARERVREIDKDKAAASAGDRYVPNLSEEMVKAYQLTPEPLHTTHFAVVDRDGNAVSSTQTLGTLFGSGCVVPGTGILLNNKAYWADRDASSPNRLAAGKKIEMSIAPVLLTRGGHLAMTAGSPGSFGILQIVPQLILNVLVHKMSPARAVSAPRVISLGLGNETYLQALEPRGDGRLLALESRIPRATALVLVQRGHDVRYVGDWANLMGCGAMIWRNPETGALVGGADPRRDSQAQCW